MTSSYQRCLVAAIFILICVLLLRSSHSPPPPSLQPKGAGSPRQQPASQLDPAILSNQNDQQRFSSEELVQKPLRERLRYQFPYGLGSKFPAYIWQTWRYTPSASSFAEDLRPMEASWTMSHPGFVHQVINDQAAVYVLTYFYAAFPEVLEAYKSMPSPVLKADFFRYLILLARGGIYTDIDTYVLRPATDWLPEDFDRSTIGLVVGIEADPDRPDWAKWYSRRIQFCQWTIQAKPGHPILRDVVATITEDTLRMKRAGNLTKSKIDKSIVEFTGPAVWTDAIFRYFNSPTYFDMSSKKGKKNITALDFTRIKEQKKVGDVVVLPITSFSPGVRQMGSEEPEHPMAFVKHEFIGTWKPLAERMEEWSDS